MVKTAADRPCISSGSTRNCAIDLQDWLDSGELLTGTPTITEVGTSDLTLANKAVSTAALTIKGRTSAAGQAIQFNVTGQQQGTTYKLLVQCDTDSTPAQTYDRHHYLECV